MLNIVIYLLLILIGSILSTEATAVTIFSSEGVRLAISTRPESVGPWAANTTGVLVSYECLRTKILNKDDLTSAINILAPRMILLLSSTNILDGHLVPFLNDSKRQDLMGEIVKSWKPKGLIYWNRLLKIPGNTDRLFGPRDWLTTFGAPILELNGIDELNKTLIYYGIWPNNTNSAINSSDLLRVEMNAQPDINHWTLVRNSGFMVFWRIFFCLLAIASGSLAGAKLIAWCRSRGLEISVAKMILLIQLLAAIFRAPYAAIDPIYMNYSGAPGYQAHMLISIHFPMNIMTILLLALYWKELLDKTRVQIAGFLSKMRIPFFLVSLIVVTAEVVASSLRAAESGSLAAAVYAIGVIYVITALTVSVFFFVTGVRVIRRLERSAKLSNVHQTIKHKSSMKKTTAYVIASGVFCLIFIAGLAQALFSDHFYSPVGFIATWTTNYLGVYGGALIQVLAIRFPDHPSDHPTSLRSRTATASTSSLSESRNVL